ncbi:hypothetical protein CABS01_06867 [Colletotrichum abscissum]|nr:uncharacterized protein CCOS01_01029 [Colletotrichum costaricense]XP_060384984.1 uncharacterized protein CTAM01_04309 [Colletotrichum tamarilloi]XP_060403916.1 uncharacterized protein CABS01_06867 [Colletotrichum abscissum]KAI3533600.1 hypothetical protein CSPX01_12673 [Colletotrichum filicis]KAK1504079.1 hypothetical protein CTAM01_04309 [Colletotrichum tamarilloi]KAK1514888.1 hypothetical protein CABS01_06867 [Colletotrichum abscissum]KAK1539715.1 hypothetical protein CCOS01_01029 [Colle
MVVPRGGLFSWHLAGRRMAGVVFRLVPSLLPAAPLQQGRLSSIDATAKKHKRSPRYWRRRVPRRMESPSPPSSQGQSATSRPCNLLVRGTPHR